MRPGLGFIDDPSEIVEAELVAHHVSGLIRSSAATAPEVFSWRAHVPAVADQWSTNSCVGQAFASSIELRAILTGHPIHRPSAKAIYDMARMLDVGKDADLLDVGSSPSRAIEGMRTYGLVAEARWPLTVENVNVKPAWDVYQNSLNARLGQHYRITPGPGACNEVRKALVAGYLPVFAMDVDQRYMDYDGTSVYRVGLESVGRHMQCVVGYAEDYFEVLNSWGPSWGDGGFARIGQDFLESRACNAWAVPTIVPIQVT